MEPTLTQRVDQNPAWLKLPLTKTFRDHIKAEAARRGITAQRLVIESILKMVGAPTKGSRQ